MKTKTGWPSIPGETPIDDVSHLLDKAIKTREQLDVAEAANIANVQGKYIGQINAEDAPFTFDWMIQLHRDMFCDVWGWAGKIRKTDLSIGVDPSRVEGLLFSLPQDISYFSTDKDQIIESAARLHHRAVWIHPFVNGNGRWSRLLTNLWLKLHKSKPTVWPDRSIGKESPIRLKYLEAIRAADNGEFDGLVKLHKEYTK